MTNASSAYGGMPHELIIHVLDCLTAQRRPELQRDVAALRLSSKLLHSIATPSFYKSIELSSHRHVRSLVAQLQAQPKLCSTTRAVFWDVREPEDEATPLEVGDPELPHLANVDDVAFCYRIDKTRIGAPVSFHFGFRDVGPWCEPVRFTRPHELVQTLQRVPVLRSSYVKRLVDIEKDEMREEELKKAWTREHPGTVAEPPFPWMLGQQEKRAIWACSVVLPALSPEMSRLIFKTKTITHLTLTFYSHYLIPVDENDSLNAQLSELLDPFTLPLLEHVEIRILDIGKKLNGFPTREASHAYSLWPEEDPITDEPVTKNVWDLDQLNAEDAQEWRGFIGEIETAIEGCSDPERVTCTVVGDADVERQPTLLADVRKYTLREWRERVKGNAGPWTHPQTQRLDAQASKVPEVHEEWDYPSETDIWDEVVEEEDGWGVDEDDEDDDDEDDEEEDWDDDEDED